MNLDFLNEVQSFNPKINENLAKYTTWKIGGLADCLIEISSSEELFQLVQIALKYKISTTILGEGSNVLISDKGLRGLVIINRSRKIEILTNTNFLNNPRIKVPHQTVGTEHYTFDDLIYEENAEKVLVKFDSGVSLPYAIGWLHKNNITGLQWFAGIPGTIGGALFNNIHGGTRHFSDYFHSAEIFINGQKQLANFDFFEFGYDQSILRKQPKMIILTITMQLERGDILRAKEVYQQWNNRKKVQPKNTCGCVFKNISDIDQQRLKFPTSSSGYIIDKILNLAGRKQGNLIISTKHAAFMENLGGATAQDALNLIQVVKDNAKQKLNIDLELEISLLGFN